MANAMAFLAPHNQFRAMGLSVAPAAMLEDVIAQYQAPLIVNVGSCVDILPHLRALRSGRGFLFRC
jgi:hypothetical protein